MADAGASQRRSQHTATTGTGQESTREPAGGKGESYFAGALGGLENDRASGTGKWKSLAQGVEQSGTDLNSDTDRFKSGPFGIVHSAHDRPSYLSDSFGADFVLPPPPVGGAQDFFKMRGRDQVCAIQPAYVYWVVTGVPDLTASQLNPGDLPCGSNPATDVVDINISAYWRE